MLYWNAVNREGDGAMRVIDMHTHIFPDKIAAKATVATGEA